MLPSSAKFMADCLPLYKMFVEFRPRFHPLFFKINLVTVFCKLDHFIVAEKMCTIKEWSNLNSIKYFVDKSPGVNLIYLLGKNLVNLFCKLDHFRAAQKI